MQNRYVVGVDQFAIRGFADAIDDIPLALAENVCLSLIEEVVAIKPRQLSEGKLRIEVDVDFIQSDGRSTR